MRNLYLYLILGVACVAYSACIEDSPSTRQCVDLATQAPKHAIYCTEGFVRDQGAEIACAYCMVQPPNEPGYLQVYTTDGACHSEGEIVLEARILDRDSPINVCEDEIRYQIR